MRPGVLQAVAQWGPIGTVAQMTCGLVVLPPLLNVLLRPRGSLWSRWPRQNPLLVFAPEEALPLALVSAHQMLVTNNALRIAMQTVCD